MMQIKLDSIQFTEQQGLFKMTVQRVIMDSNPWQPFSLQ